MMEQRKAEPEDVILQKRELRRKILAVRDAMSEAQRKKASCLLADRIIGHQWFYRAGNILGFISFGSEIDTSEILQEAFRKGKNVFVPKVTGNVMDFYQISSPEDLQKGYCGILEPVGNTLRYEDNPDFPDKTLMLMPGVAFDRQRNRLGYGRGFYDRYLALRRELQLHTIGIGFACQLTEEIPHLEEDSRPYQVIIQ